MSAGGPILGGALVGLAVLALHEGGAAIRTARSAPGSQAAISAVEGPELRRELSRIAQARAGRWTMEDLSGPVGGAARPDPVASLVGRFAKATSLSAASAWRLARWGTGITLFLLLAFAAQRVVPDARGGGVALLVAALAGGLEALAPGGLGAADGARADAFPFVASLAGPSSALRCAIPVAALLLWHPAVEGRIGAQLALAAIVGVGGWVDPRLFFVLALAGAVAGGFDGSDTRFGFGGIAAIGLGGAASFGLRALAGAPEGTPGGPSARLFVLLGAAAALPGAGFATYRFVRWGGGVEDGTTVPRDDSDRAIRFAIGWGAAGLLLALLPLESGGIAPGLFVPLTLLAVRGVWESWGRWSWRTAVPLGALALSLPGGAVSAWRAAVSTEGARGAPLPEVYGASIAHLADEVVGLASVTLAAPEIGAYLAAAGIRAVGSADDRSEGAEDRQVAARAFLSAAPGFDRAGFLKRHRVEYLLFGPVERAMGIWRPEADPAWRSVLRDGTVRLFRMAPPAPTPRPRRPRR